MKHFLIILIVISLYWPCVVMGQVKINELLNQIESSESDSIRIRSMNEAAFYYIFNDPEKALSMIYKGKTMAKSTGFLFGYNELLNTQGVYFDVLHQVDSAAYYFQQALQLSQQKKWPHIEEKSLNNLGMNYWNKGNFDLALQYFSQALALNEKNLPANQINRAKYLNNIGLINQELRKFDVALSYHKKALAIREQLALPNDQAISRANLGVCYKNTGNHTLAVENYTQAIALSKQAGNQRMYYALHDNLGNTFLDQKEYETALTYFLVSVQRGAIIGANPKTDLSTLSNLTTIFVEMNKPEKALTYSKQALDILDNNPELEAFAATLLKATAQAQYLLGNSILGNEFLTRYTTVIDSTFSQQHATVIANLEAKLGNEEKEKKIALQNIELVGQRATIQRNVFIFIFLLVVALFSVMLTILLINRNRKKEQLLLQQQEIRIKEAQISSALTSKEEEHKRFAQDLHDGLGQLVSGLKMTLAGLENNPDTEKRLSIAKTSEKILDEMRVEIKSIAFNLMPPTLINGGLIKALEELALRVNKSGGLLALEVSSYDFPERLPEVYEINLYRIAQEWVNNIVKHNQAHRIEIQLIGHADEWVVTIDDDGNGFDKTILNKAKGHGWQNLLSRINLMKGEYTLETTVGVKGTSFMIIVPSLSLTKENRELLTKNTANS